MVARRSSFVARLIERRTARPLARRSERATSDEQRATSTTRARLALLAGAALFSTGGAAIKLCGLTAWQVASFRSAVAVAALLALLRVRPREVDRQALLVGLAYASTMILFVLGNKLTTAANTIFLQSTAPLYVLLLGPLLLGEANRRSDLVVMVAMAIGLTLFFVGEQPSFASAPDPLRGNVIAALGGVAWALTVLGFRWIGRDPGRRVGATLVSGNVLACAATLPLALPVTGGGARDWAVVVYLGIFQIALAYIFLSAGLREVTALEGILLLLLEPVLNPLWAGLLHGERPGGWAIGGGAIVLAATLFKSLADSPRARRPTSTADRN
jgi:drug/metabolite transporter (DMT)-like permease